ncbi:NYN domain-containing protein [Patescibacteria group bacterium]|nr:NYN domain-containing protein [Patescibacteria group bacterium]
MEDRIFIIIDGNNFYHRLKEVEIKNLLDFDYEKFSQFLSGKRELVLKKYYIGAIREETNNPKSRQLMSAQQKLLGKLKKNNWALGLGELLKTDKYHEKGVDVLMAVDLLIGAYENTYDTVILVTSDTDLLPAIEKVRSMNKKIEYIGFSHKPSLALIANSDIRRLLIKDELETFFIK